MAILPWRKGQSWEQMEELGRREEERDGELEEVD